MTLPLLALAIAVRAFVAWRTVVPARDAEAYLWMADRIAEGDIAAAFRTVFHPGLSFLVGGVRWIAPWAPSVPTAQVVSCGLGALAILPLMRGTTRLFGGRAAAFAGLAYALGVWFARHPADCLSEGPFFLLVAAAFCVVAHEPRGIAGGGRVGALAGVAFAFRPEGIAIALLGAPWFAFARRDLRAGLATLGLATLLITPWVVGWSISSGGLVFTPKAAFNYEQGIGGDGSAIAHYLTHAWRILPTAFDAVGFVILPLAAIGMWRGIDGWRSPQALLVALFVLQCAIVPALRSNVRFLAGYGLLLLPFAARAAVGIAERVPRRATRAALLALCFASDVARLPVVRREDRRVLVELGAWIRDRLAPGETIATEMPRLAYFAGVEPPPPRPIRAAELERWLRRPEVRFLCTLPARTWGGAGARVAPPGFAAVRLPEPLASQAANRGLIVLERAP